MFHTSKAQSSDYPHSIQLNYYKGFVLIHHPELRSIITGNPVLYELDYRLSTFGNKAWHTLYRFPKWGFSLSMTDYKNPQQIGYSYQITPYLSFPVIKSKYFDTAIRIGWGLSYITKTFNAVSNYKNNAIGSHLNATTLGSLEFYVKPVQNIQLKAGINFYHISNGAITKPNLGINIPSASLGLAYAFGKQKPLVTDTATFDRAKEGLKNKKWTGYMQLLGGVKEPFPIHSKKYPAFSLGYILNKNLGKKSFFSIGGEVFYNFALEKDLENKGIAAQNSLDILQIGIPVYYGLRVGPLKMMYCWGTYIYSKHHLDGNFYHRLGISYQVNDTWTLHHNLKTHFARADYFEFGASYQIH